jgi:hypothetical protein
MSHLTGLFKKPVFIYAVILPIVVMVEFAVLEGLIGVSFPAERGSARSTYELRQKGKESHFITRNTRFLVVDDLRNNHLLAFEPLVLRESVLIDRQEGIEGAYSIVKVEALDENAVKWRFEEPGERGEVIDRVYEVIKLGCCDAPNTYTYFSLHDGKKLRSTHMELNSDELVELLKSLQD